MHATGHFGDIDDGELMSEREYFKLGRITGFQTVVDDMLRRQVFRISFPRFAYYSKIKQNADVWPSTKLHILKYNSFAPIINCHNSCFG